MKQSHGAIPVLAGILLTLCWLPVSADDYVVRSGSMQETLAGQSIFEIEGSKNLNGEIRILSRQSGDIKISWEKKARASSKSESARFLELIDFRLSMEDERVVFRILSPSHAPWEGSNHSVNAAILIELPEKMKVEGGSKFMKFDIEGPFQGVSVESSFSPVSIRRIFGPVEARTSFGEISLEAIKGEVKATTENGGIEAVDIIIPSGYALFRTNHAPIMLENIQGPVEAYTSHSGVEASKVEATYGSIVLRTSYAPLDLDRVTGELICETSYGPITIVDTDVNHGHSRIETSYGSINADFSGISNCDLYISNDYSNVDLTLPSAVSARLVAGVGGGGRIHTSDLNLKPTLLDLTRLEAVAGGGESRIEVNVNGIGNINITGR